MASSFDTLPAIVQSDVDLFGPATLTVEQAVTSLHSPSVQSNGQRSLANKQMEVTAGLDTQRLYCSTCRKSFATEATWQTHLRSTKHINAIKAQRQPTTAARKQQQQQQQQLKSSDTPINITLNKKENNAKVTEIVSKRRQAERIASTKQATAATVYFNMAKALWQANAARETAKTLDMLYTLLKQNSIASEEQEKLSTSQTRKLAGLSTVGLMRIYAVSGQYAIAVDKGILAFTEYTELNRDAIQQLALAIDDDIPVVDIQHKCRTLAKQATLRKSTDSCLVGSQLLQEIAGYAMMEASSQARQGKPVDGILTLVLALYMLAFELSRREKSDLLWRIMALYQASKIYAALMTPWCRADVLLLAMELIIHSEYKEQFITKHALLWNTILSDLLDMFLESIEDEDYVLCEAFEQLFTLPTLLYANPNDEHSCKYMDIEYLIELSRACRLNDQLWLFTYGRMKWRQLTKASSTCSSYSMQQAITQLDWSISRQQQYHRRVEQLLDTLLGKDITVMTIKHAV